MSNQYKNLWITIILYKIILVTLSTRKTHIIHKTRNMITMKPRTFMSTDLCFTHQLFKKLSRVLQQILVLMKGLWCYQKTKERESSVLNYKIKQFKRVLKWVHRIGLNALQYKKIIRTFSLMSFFHKKIWQFKIIKKMIWIRKIIMGIEVLNWIVRIFKPRKMIKRGMIYCSKKISIPKVMSFRKLIERKIKIFKKAISCNRNRFYKVKESIKMN